MARNVALLYIKTFGISQHNCPFSCVCASLYNRQVLVGDQFIIAVEMLLRDFGT